jgi:poly(A) polymerase Pap1
MAIPSYSNHYGQHQHPAVQEVLYPVDEEISKCFATYISAHSCDHDALNAKGKQVTAQIQTIVDKWMHQQPCNDEGGPLSALCVVGGSYLLGVADEQSDIDIVCVCPSSISSEDFFAGMLQILGDEPGVQDCCSVKQATVPHICFAMEGISIDLLLCRWPSQSGKIPSVDVIYNDTLVSTMDGQSLLSLNMLRVSVRLLQLVPDVNNFQYCLTAVRKWAIARGIYGSKLGFLGGVSWAIAVGTVCQFHPHATVSQLLHFFFEMMSGWSWPLPLMMYNHVLNNCAALPQSIARLQFNPHECRSGHVMPIITPGCPSLNSAVSVTHATLQVMRREFKRAFATLNTIVDTVRCSPAASHAILVYRQANTKKISLKKKKASREGLQAEFKAACKWTQLFERRTEICFFKQHRHFIAIEVSNQGEGHINWSEYSNRTDWVVCKLRKLVEALEWTTGVVSVCPYSEPITTLSKLTSANDVLSDSEETVLSRSSAAWMVGFNVLSRSPSGGGTRMLSGANGKDGKDVETWAHRIGSVLKYFVSTAMVETSAFPCAVHYLSDESGTKTSLTDLLVDPSARLVTVAAALAVAAPPALATKTATPPLPPPASAAVAPSWADAEDDVDIVALIAESEDDADDDDDDDAAAAAASATPFAARVCMPELFTTIILPDEAEDETEMEEFPVATELTKAINPALSTGLTLAEAVEQKAVLAAANQRNPNKDECFYHEKASIPTVADHCTTLAEQKATRSSAPYVRVFSQNITTDSAVRKSAKGQSMVGFQSLLVADSIELQLQTRFASSPNTANAGEDFVVVVKGSCGAHQHHQNAELCTHCHQAVQHEWEAEHIRPNSAEEKEALVHKKCYVEHLRLLDLYEPARMLRDLCST